MGGWFSHPLLDVAQSLRAKPTAQAAIAGKEGLATGPNPSTKGMVERKHLEDTSRKKEKGLCCPRLSLENSHELLVWLK